MLFGTVWVLLGVFGVSLVCCCVLSAGVLFECWVLLRTVECCLGVAEALIGVVRVWVLFESCLLVLRGG